MRGNPQANQAVDEKNCLRCHGEKVDGNGPEGQYLIVYPSNLQAITSRTKSDWELLITISHGSAFTPMHGFRGKLTDQQVMDVRPMCGDGAVRPALLTFYVAAES